MTDAAPETFGRYELIRRLAFGGMAEIFLAALRRDQGFEKRIVLKRILPQYGTDETFVQMFVDEAVVAAQITHPNVVQVFDFGNVDGVYFIAMEYVDGVDLRCVLKRAESPDTRLSAAQVAAIGEQTARGLDHAHTLKDNEGRELLIVHRDVSPHNIMLSRAGEAKLMDFGIAKAQARAGKTATGTIKGKVAYMAPEQAAAKDLDHRCDQFALGLVLWECLSGERMFEGSSDLEMLRKVVACEVRPLKPLRSDTPDRLEQIITKMLARQPSDRFPEMHSVAEALSSFRFSLGAEGSVDLGALVADVAPSAGQGRMTKALPVRGDREADTMQGSLATEEKLPSGWGTRGPAAVSATAATLAGGRSDPATLRQPVPESDQPLSQRLRFGEGSGDHSQGLIDRLSSRGSAPWVAVGLVGLAIAIAMVLVANRVRRERTSLAPVVEMLVPALSGTLELVSEPEGARILVSGLPTGLVTPASIPGQTLGEPTRVALLLDGFEPWGREVTLHSSRERLEVHLSRTGSTVLPDAAHAEPAAGSAERTHAPLEKEPRAGAREGRAATRPPRKKGKLWMRSTTAWVEVFHGKQKLGTTPLAGIEVPAGKLRLRLVNRAAGIDERIGVEIRSGGELRKTISPRAAR